MKEKTAPPASIFVRLLGTPHLICNGQSVTIPRNQVRALFYRLAGEQDWLARQHLCFLFWPDVADTTARQNLTLALSHLRRALPWSPMLMTDNEKARLDMRRMHTDVAQFTALCTGEDDQIARRKAAIALYNGPFLDGVATDNSPEFEHWIATERSRYERLFLDALSTLIADAMARKAYAEALDYAQKYLQVDPLEEEIHRRIIEAYAASGDRAAAMLQYEECARVLQKELGVSPTVETAAVYEAAQHERPTNLPVPPTKLIGRHHELASVIGLLCREDVWLVTLNGPGGCGKTRLAQAAAEQLLVHFAHGVYFVDLARIDNPQLIVGTIAHTLGLPDANGQSAKKTLCRFLRDKQVLLVLDNFEQLLGAAPQLTDLHAAAPGLKILVTSRVVLHLRGEQEAPVPPLPVASPAGLPSPAHLLESAAVRLFVERARNVRPDFELTETNAAAVAGICEQVDGLPLAIEMAAALCKLLSPQLILERLADPLTLLSHGQRDLPDRQQTLHATLNWSADLLDSDKRALFRRLGVFRGNFTLANAEAICNANGGLKINVLDGLAALLDHNLIHCAGKPSDEQPRFTMLATTRSFAYRELEVHGELETLYAQRAGS